MLLRQNYKEEMLIEELSNLITYKKENIKKKEERKFHSSFFLLSFFLHFVFPFIHFYYIVSSNAAIYGIDSSLMMSSKSCAERFIGTSCI